MKIISNVSVGLLSLLFIFAVSELMVRVYLFGDDALSYNDIRSFQTFGKSGLLQRSPHREIALEFQANIRTRHKLALFETNSEGLRDKDYPKTKPGGYKRVAVVGDSFTAGPGILIEDTYHSILEEHYFKKVEFINFGVNGHYLRQYPAVIRHKALDYHPDLIIVGFCAANDREIPPELLFSDSYQIKKFKNGFFTSYFVKLLKHNLDAQRKGNPAKRKISKEQIQYILKYISELGKISSDNDVPILLAFLNNYPADYEVIEKIALNNGLLFVDTSNRFVSIPIQEVSTFAIDQHPNKRAHQIFAEVIYNKLKESELLAF